MGRKLNISKTVIKFILDKRNDVNTYYTFEEIKKMLKNEFNIDMSLQAVRYQYERNKDNQAILNNVVSSSVTQEKPTSKIDFRALREKRNTETKKTGFDKTAGDDLTREDIARLLGKAVD